MGSLGPPQAGWTVSPSLQCRGHAWVHEMHLVTVYTFFQTSGRVLSSPTTCPAPLVESKILRQESSLCCPQLGGPTTPPITSQAIRGRAGAALTPHPSRRSCWSVCVARWRPASAAPSIPAPTPPPCTPALTGTKWGGVRRWRPPLHACTHISPTESPTSRLGQPLGWAPVSGQGLSAFALDRICSEPPISNLYAVGSPLSHNGHSQGLERPNATCTCTGLGADHWHVCGDPGRPIFKGFHASKGPVLTKVLG